MSRKPSTPAPLGRTRAKAGTGRGGSASSSPQLVSTHWLNRFAQRTLPEETEPSQGIDMLMDPVDPSPVTENHGDCCCFAPLYRTRSEFEALDASTRSSSPSPSRSAFAID